MSERDMLTDATAGVKQLMDSRAPTYVASNEDLARAALEGAGLLLSVDQPRPVPNEHPFSHDMLDARMEHLRLNFARANLPAIALLRSWNADRKKIGEVKYGVALQPFNGRVPAMDGILEALDFLVYLEQLCYEKRNDEVAEHDLREVQEVVFGVCVDVVRDQLLAPGIVAPLS